MQESNNVKSATVQACEKLSQEQLVDALAVMAKDLKRSYKRKEKTSETEINAGLVSRAKGTTLVAQSWKATESYYKQLESIKTLISYLW